MDILEASQLAEKLIVEHGLEGWSFKLNSARRQLGICREHCKRIELSRHYVVRNPHEHVRDTVLHEIAHALVGTQHGHDAKWKAMCLQLGCAPKACENEAVMPEGNWRAECPNCRKVYSQHRRPRYMRGLYCRRCGPDKGSLRFNNVSLAYQKRVEKAAQGESAQLMLKLFTPLIVFFACTHGALGASPLPRPEPSFAHTESKVSPLNGLTLEAKEIADLSGITPVLAQLEFEQRFAAQPGKEISHAALANRQKLIYLRVKLTAQIQDLNLKINSTRGLIERSTAKADELRAYITEQRNRQTHRNSQVNLLSGGVTKMVGYGIALAPGITSIPTNVLEVFDGSVQSSLSALALREQQRENKLEHGMPPILRSFLYDTSTPTICPAVIWNYLNNPPVGAQGPESRRQLLIASWRKAGILPPVNRQSKPHEQVTVQLLDERLAMLSDLESVISQMHNELMQLSDAVLASYSQDPEF